MNPTPADVSDPNHCHGPRPLTEDFQSTSGSAPSRLMKMQLPPNSSISDHPSKPALEGPARFIESVSHQRRPPTLGLGFGDLTPQVGPFLMPVGIWNDTSGLSTSAGLLGGDVVNYPALTTAFISQQWIPPLPTEPGSLPLDNSHFIPLYLPPGASRLSTETVATRTIFRDTGTRLSQRSLSAHLTPEEPVDMHSGQSDFGHLACEYEIWQFRDYGNLFSGGPPISSFLTAVTTSISESASSDLADKTLCTMPCVLGHLVITYPQLSLPGASLVQASSPGEGGTTTGISIDILHTALVPHQNATKKRKVHPPDTTSTLKKMREIGACI